MNKQLPVIEGQPKVLKHNVKYHDQIRETRPTTEDKCAACIDYKKQLASHEKYKADHPDHADGYYNWMYRKPDPIADNHQHTETINPISNSGAGYLERKASGELVYHTPWLRVRKPFTMTNPKARVEKPAKMIERVIKDINDMDESRTTAKEMAGTPFGKYTCLATDGHRMLMDKSKPTKPARANVKIGQVASGAQLISIDNPEFHNLIKRALVATGHSRMIILKLDGTSLTVESTDHETTFFDETITVQNNADHAWKIALDAAYVETILGVWPLHIWVKDAESEVLFETDGWDWRYVLMPMRA